MISWGDIDIHLGGNLLHKHQEQGDMTAVHRESVGWLLRFEISFVAFELKIHDFLECPLIYGFLWNYPEGVSEED